MPVEACRHCGVRVLLQADGRCPSCQIPQQAPVTDAHRTRIEAHRRAQAERPLRREQARLQQQRAQTRRRIGLGALVLAGGLGTAAAFSTTGDGIYLAFLLLVAAVVSAAIASAERLLGAPHVRADR